MKSLGSPVTKLRMAVRNAENEVVWGGEGALKVNDRAHTTSYSTLIETMRLSCTAFEIGPIASYLSKVADFDPPHLHSRPRRG